MSLCAPENRAVQKLSIIVVVVVVAFVPQLNSLGVTGLFSCAQTNTFPTFFNLNYHPAARAATPPSSEDLSPLLDAGGCDAINHG